MDMMMALGQFVFCLDTLAYQELQRQMKWRHASNSRIGARAARQFLGVGDDTFQLSGVLMPELTGGTQSLDELREMGNLGASWPLVDGTGIVYGLYVIEGLTETKTVFLSNGAARRIEFQLQLERVDDELTDSIGEDDGSSEDVAA
ncbi:MULTISPECIES: phage tail protein [unclassified Variovorax]|uniref:phage tail protein n=1 Tax=unclassified Variovorax TaxID=663243 RepID=UPI000A99FE3A|nr:MULTISPECIES: phage tail protein [unclassified Variovorax]